MSDVDFRVTDVFDVQSRGGLLVAGRLVAGEVAGGTDLRNEATGEAVHVLAVEFHGGGEAGRFTLVVARDRAGHVQAGTRLTD
jgi:hypothetical protein